MNLSERDQALFECQPDDDECVEWERYRDKDGYGRLRIGGRKGRTYQTHRAAWEFSNGKIPKAKHVLHRCDNPPCVRRDHLWLGTHQDNIADRDAKGRQYRDPALVASCILGHKRTDTTTYTSPSGHRACRRCNALAVARYQAKRKEWR